MSMRLSSGVVDSDTSPKVDTDRRIDMIARRTAKLAVIKSIQGILGVVALPGQGRIDLDKLSKVELGSLLHSLRRLRDRQPGVQR